MSYEEGNNNYERKNAGRNKDSREGFNEQRKIGKQPDTTLTSKPNTTKPNKRKD